MSTRQKNVKVIDTLHVQLRRMFVGLGYGRFIELSTWQTPEDLRSSFCGYVLVGTRYGIAVHHTEDGILQYTTFIWPAQAKQTWNDVMQKGVPEKWVVARTMPSKVQTFMWILDWIFQELSLDTYNIAPQACDFIRDLFASDLTAVGIAKRMKQYKLMPGTALESFILDSLKKAMR